MTVKFYWVKDKVTGEVSVVSTDDRYDERMAWSVLGDEQDWGKEDIYKQFDVLGEADPPVVG